MVHEHRIEARTAHGVLNWSSRCAADPRYALCHFAYHCGPTRGCSAPLRQGSSLSWNENARVESGSGREAEHVLDEGRDIAYQRREWIAQRIGWVMIALLVVAALLGMLGSVGPFATAHMMASDGSIDIDYTRLERHHAPARIVIEVAPEFAETSEVRLWLDADYVQTTGLQSIVPEPESVELGSERVIYVFAIGEGNGPAEISFAYEHDGLWQQEARLGLVNGATVELNQFIFP
jgi:hypothetical protein